MKRNAPSGEQDTFQRRVAVMSLSDMGPTTKQYATLEYDRTTNICKVTYAPKRPRLTLAQQRKGRDVETLGPQTREELRINMPIILQGMQPPLWSVILFREPYGSEGDMYILLAPPPLEDIPDPEPKRKDYEGVESEQC